MAKYLKIANRGSVPRELWELVGATSKDKKDSLQIGFKGSGAKFAVVPALRLGLGLTITSSDSDGPYILTYRTKRSRQGFRQIFLSYNDEEAKPTSFTMNSLQGWDEPIGDDTICAFKLLREVIANARDADPEFGIRKVSSIKPPKAGETCVYIGWSDEFAKIFKRPERYFKFLSNDQPIATVKISHRKALIVKLYPRSQDGYIRIFIQDVLVYCGAGEAAFDYSFDDKDLLSEERVIHDWGNLLEDVYSSLTFLNDEAAIASVIFALLAQTSLEREAICRCHDSVMNGQYFDQDRRAKWHNAWIELFGDKALLSMGNNEIDRDLEFRQHIIISVRDYSIASFLEAQGLPTSSGKYLELSKKERVKAEELTEVERNTINEAIRILQENYPDAVKLPRIYFFRQKFQTENGVTTLEGEGAIWINVAVLAEGVPRTLQTLEHEYRHHVTKRRDYEREFIQSGDPVIAKLLMARDKLMRGE